MLAHLTKLISQNLPSDIKVFLTDKPQTQTVLHPLEAPFIPQGTIKNQINFYTGRYCAHQVIQGHSKYILKGLEGEPIWAKNQVGSISHSHQYWVAIGCLKKYYSSLGVDIQYFKNKNPNDINEHWVKRICTPTEQNFYLNSQKSELSLKYSLLLFSAKESAYKCVYSLFKQKIFFQDFQINLTQPLNNHGTLQITILPHHSITPTLNHQPLHGIYYYFNGYVFTALWIP